MKTHGRRNDVTGKFELRGKQMKMNDQKSVSPFEDKIGKSIVARDKYRIAAGLPKICLSVVYCEKIRLPTTTGNCRN